jgi:hypothetical protein
MRRHRHGKRTADRLSALNLAALDEIFRGWLPLYMKSRVAHPAWTQEHRKDSPFFFLWNPLCPLFFAKLEIDGDIFFCLARYLSPEPNPRDTCSKNQDTFVKN